MPYLLDFSFGIFINVLIMLIFNFFTLVRKGLFHVKVMTLGSKGKDDIILAQHDERRVSHQPITYMVRLQTYSEDRVDKA